MLAAIAEYSFDGKMPYSLGTGLSFRFKLVAMLDYEERPATTIPPGHYRLGSRRVECVRHLHDTTPSVWLASMMSGCLFRNAASRHAKFASLLHIDIEQQIFNSRL